MSPNIWLEITDDGDLIATDGNRDDPTYTWSYSDFEEFTREAITPSMYQFMVNYVYDNLDKEALYDIESDSYDCRYEEDAAEAYFDLPWQERLAMHRQTVNNIEAEIRRWRAKAAECDAVPPFDPNSTIYVECYDFLRGLKDKCNAKLERLERELHEEENWRGGWEEGQSETGDQPRYDPMEE